MTKPVRILVVEDHELMREALRARLKKQPNWKVVGEATTGREAIDIAARLLPDVIVMDIGLPDINGLDATAQIRATQAAVKVIVLSAWGNPEYVARAVKSGASAYLIKDSAAIELIVAVRAVLEGKSYFSMAQDSGPTDEPPESVKELYVDKLTARQREVVTLIAEGKNTKEIAYLLRVSVKTVESHRTQLMDRLRIHDVAGLVRYAMRAGLVRSEL